MNENNNKILLELKKKEGLVEFFLPKYYDIKNSFINNDVLEKDTISKSLPVFYNENMIFNRDITEIIVCIYSKLLGRKLKFLDLMAASGIRSIRLLKETDCVEKIYINDLNPLAVKYIEKNLDFNNISNEKYEIFNEDAIIAPLWLSKKTGSNNEYFDVIDIDPFGSPAKYLPSAIQAIKLNGLLCVTATDTPVLFGIKKIQCLRKYLTLPIKTDFLKEVGIRILIYYVMKICNIFELYVEPILSISSDHYIRIFLIVKKGLSGCNNNIKNFGYYIFCPNCLFRDIKKFYENENEFKCSKYQDCPKCNSKLYYSGILWLGNLHNEIYQNKLKEYVNRKDIESLKMFFTLKKIKKYIDRSIDEDKFPPYYYSISKLADIMNVSAKSMNLLIENLKSLGFNSSRTHFDSMGIKTNASIEIIKKILQ